MTHVVVIGAGQAGSSLCAKLRNLGFEGAITLIGEEPVPPYQRPPLSKAYLLGEMEEERLYLRPEAFYADNAITLRLGASAANIDTLAQTLTLGGDTLSYDHLVFTTGSTPRRLPTHLGGDLKGVFTVRDLADVDAMAPYVTQGKRALVIGGGYIGLEAAAVARKRGVDVTLVEASERILQRVAAPETSDFFRALHESHGVTIREGVGFETFTGQDHVNGGVLTDETEIDIDFAIVGIGITPATGAAEAAGITIENGIETDTQGRCSAPGTWAAGDCASFPLNGAQMRLESVGNAIDQAELVAENIMGAGKEYTPKPWFWSDQYDVKLQIAGLNIGYDRVVTRKTGDAVSHWYYLGDALLAVDAMNDPRNYMVGKRLIEAGKHPAPDIIADPETDMKALLRA
ncbi:MAG: FAD/NAD(P)-binding oxidoreductase [Pseudomonadota bacterium]